MNKPTLILYTFLFLFLNGESQDYLEMMNSDQYTVLEVQNAAQIYFENKDKGRGTGYKSFKRWEYNALRMQNEYGFLKSPSFYYEELERYNSEANNSKGLNRTSLVSNWEELGPTYWNQTSGWNPGVGRITSIAIDAYNANHIIIGSPGGGVWKTSDGGANWSVLTDNLSNIYVSALTIDPVNSSIYYWGSTSGIIFKSTDAGATWNQFADTGSGVVNKILINPYDTSKMFCSSQYDGVYKSTDGGVNWSSIHSESTTGFDVEFKPGDTNTVYASGNSFFKSTDGGQSFIKSLEYTTEPYYPLEPISWTQENVNGYTAWELSSSNENNSVVPKSGSRLALFYRADYNEVVTKLISPQLNLIGSTAPELKFSYSNVKRGDDLDELKVFYKTGINETWIELAYYTSEIISWEDIVLSLPNPTSDYYIAFEGTSNYGRGVTLDDVSVEDSTLGVVFLDNFDTKIPSSIETFSNSPKMIGVSADNPAVVYILEASGSIFGGFYKSIDSGANFTKLDHSEKNYFGYSSNASGGGGQAPRDMDVVVNPNDAEDVHIAGVLSWRSTNAGIDFNITSQWIPENAVAEGIGYCHADIDVMIYQNDKIYVGSDGGIFVANDPLNVNSTYYTDLTSGLGIRQFYKIGISQTDPVIVSGGSQDNGTSVYTADKTWADWLGADGMESFVDHSDSNILYGTSQFGSLYKSINQGQSIIGLSRPGGKIGNWVTPFEQDPLVSTTIYSGYDEIYKSIDGGQNWTSISQNFGKNADHLKIAPSDSNTMYAAVGFNLYKTTNGGSIENWTQLSGFLGKINSIAIHPANPNKLAIATSSSNKVYISSDGGENWSVATQDIPNFSALALVWDTTYDEDILYLGMNYGVYYLRDNETTWTSYNSDLPNVKINELEVNTADNKLYAATYGRGIWSVDLFNPSTFGVDDLEITGLILSPNPSTGTFKLNWKLNKQVTIKIYDPLGKLVFYEKNRDLSQNPEIELKVPKGLYFLKVNTANREITKKLIVK